MRIRSLTTVLLPSALTAATLTAPAVASDFTISLRGRINTISAPLPPPFDTVVAGDNFHFSMAVMDQPIVGMDQIEYPVDFSDTRLTIGGTTITYPATSAPANVTFLNDLDFGGFGADRMALLSMPWAGSLAIMRVDDPTRTQFDALDLHQFLGLDLGLLDPDISFITLISSPAVVNIALEEIRFGDGANAVPAALGDGSGAACPCGNEATDGQGCTNSTGAGGMLSAYGSASVATDDLGFWADQLPPSSTAILFSGSTGLNGGLGDPFGSGLRAGGGSLQRLGLRTVDSAGRAEWSAGVLGNAGAIAGTTHWVQAWYRDMTGPCGGTTFNVTQAIAVTVQP